MKFRTTGILLLVFALLAAYVFFVEMKKQPAVTPVDQSTWILTLAKDDVQQISVTDGGQTTLVALSEGAWYVGGVGGQEADPTRMESLVASLVDLKATRVLTETAESLASYGLESPPVSVTLGLADGKQEVLAIGNKNPQGSQYYMQRKGKSPVYMVYSYLVDDVRQVVSAPPYKPTPTPAPETTAAPAAATVAPAGTATP